MWPASSSEPPAICHSEDNFSGIFLITEIVIKVSATITMMIFGIHFLKFYFINLPVYSSRQVHFAWTQVSCKQRATSARLERQTRFFQDKAGMRKNTMSGVKWPAFK
ncbi:hypothetical protein [Undibacterium sp. TJN19]|uniref:hypothetical protein n=1 Tax=Undibacterium sp. TJN19 TaxID=3413055 RepID=UPI003BF0D1B5